MPKKKSKENPDIGRPEKYKPEYDTLAEKVCRLGATDLDLAAFFEVVESTIYEWKLKHPSFSEALKRGKVLADMEVSEKLFNKAIGYEKQDCEKVFQFQGEIIKAKVKEYFPPDTTACIFWLKNRQPDKWRDKQDVNHSGEVTHNISDTKFSLKVKKNA